VSTVRVAAVQGGGQRGLTELETGQPGDFGAELEASLLLHGRPRPALVVWPEDVVAIEIPLNRSVEAEQVGELAKSLGATVLAGVTITEPNGVYRNEIVAFGPSGRVISVFEKVHRVPFGEYVPFRGFFSHFASLAAVPSDAIPGHGSGLMRTSAGPIGVLVSFEVFFSERGRSSVAAGARLLVVPTNTSSYGTAQMPSQEVAADQVQAVAQGRDLVQAAPTGYSTFVTNDGSVVQQSALSERRVLVGTVAMRSGATLYQQSGDLPVLALAAVGVIAGVAIEVGRRRRRARGADQTPEPTTRLGRAGRAGSAPEHQPDAEPDLLDDAGGRDGSIAERRGSGRVDPAVSPGAGQDPSNPPPDG
jgi:apolipoprotein N-acyltransferase